MNHVLCVQNRVVFYMDFLSCHHRHATAAATSACAAPINMYILQRFFYMGGNDAILYMVTYLLI
jgi:hypothetical protein